MRNECDEILGSLEELFTIAREARLPAHVSHLKLGGRNNWGRTTEVLQAIADARAAGLDITQDVYAYTASSTGVSSLIPEEAREGGKFEERMADPGQRADVIARMKERANERGGDFSYAVIASHEHDPNLNGLTIKEAALRTRGDDSLAAQIDTILEIQLNGGAAGVFHSMNEEDLRAFMRHPNTMLAADSSVRTWQHGVPHPRGYGNNARVLGRYVREEAVLSLEDAIRRMTFLPATTFRIKDRGVIREGAWADLAVFDPAKVRDNATFEQPHQYATGFRLVLVNGRPIVENDGPTGHKPGVVVRRGQ
jgi:N-acyl-D-amino-acid deacylase